MSFPITFIIDNRPIAEGRIGFSWIHAERQAPVSLAFFCPRCGEVWAKAVVPAMDFMVYTIECSKHPPTSPFSVPGSLWLPWDLEFLLSFPRPILEREFQLHLNHFERFLHDPRH